MYPEYNTETDKIWKFSVKISPFSAIILLSSGYQPRYERANAGRGNIYLFLINNKLVIIVCQERMLLIKYIRHINVIFLMRNTLLRIKNITF